MRLLLVEDDRLIGRGVQETLRDEGYTVDWVRVSTAPDVLRELLQRVVRMQRLGGVVKTHLGCGRFCEWLLERGLRLAIRARCASPFHSLRTQILH